LKIYEKGTLLVAMYGATIGKIAITKFEACTNQACCSLVSSKLISTKFAFYWFIANKENIINLSYGGGQPNISQDVIRSLRIPVCDITEQQSIVRFLDHKTDQIDRFITNRQKQIELLKEQKSAIINKAVTKGINPDSKMKPSGIDWIGEIPETWRLWKLKYLTRKIGSGVTPLGGSQVYKAQGIAFFRSQNVYNEAFELSNISFIDEETHQGMMNSKIEYGDVLLNITGASIGRCYFYSGEYPEANVNQHVCIIRSNKRILFKFLHLVMISEIGQNQIFSKQSGTNREGLNFEQLKQFDIPLPSKPEQQAILNHIESETSTIDTLISKYQKQIDLMQEYRTSLISQAVTGKIDVRDWQPKTGKHLKEQWTMVVTSTN